MWLAPQHQAVQFSTPVAAAPNVIPIESEGAGEGPALPKDGRAGDLISIADKQGQCTLWFRVKGERAAGGASWAQILPKPVV